MNLEKVFMLDHAYDLGDGVLQHKIIGVYSSLEAAKEAYHRKKVLPGFMDYPNLVACSGETYFEDENGFTIGPLVVDMDYWDGGFFTV